MRLDLLTRDVELLIELGELKPSSPFQLRRAPTSYQEAEAAARDVRAHLGVHGPLIDLATHAERLGVYLFALALSSQASAPEGAYLGASGWAVAVVNGDLDAGRRRYTAAHELGHHVFQDAFSTDWDIATATKGERLVNAFAVHLLLPREAVLARWHEVGGSDAARSAAIRLAAEFRTSWTATCNQLKTLELIDGAQRSELIAWPPGHADYLELELDVVEELSAPSLPPPFVAAALRAYRHGKISEGRATELLRGKLAREELPAPDVVPIEGFTDDLTE